jgi:hypothetical protein
MSEHNTLLLDADGAEVGKLNVDRQPNGHPPQVVVTDGWTRAFLYKAQHPERWDVAVYYEVTINSAHAEAHHE